ncbi:MAG: ATP synthase F1 subunit gamma [Candidatus Omnitrophota bacterium]
MSQQLRHLKSRIRSIEGTWKVTRAMEMVSMAKFKGLDAPLTAARFYFSRIESILNNLLAADTDMTHPYFRRRDKGAIGLVVITSDTGLCGGYTDQILSQADAFLAAHKDRDIRLYVYGRKGQSYFRRIGREVYRYFPGAHGRLSAVFHQELTDAVLGDYNKKELAEVHVCYTLFKSAMKYIPSTAKFLHIDPKPRAAGGDFIIESGIKGILSDLLPMYLASRMRLLMLESFTCEQAARMVSMKSAKDNAKELMGDLILLRNKIRQAAITKEVIEIISSAEALKG